MSLRTSVCDRYPPLLPFRSICLLLQVAFPCLLFAPEPTSLVLKGGTNADMAPPIDYFVKVFFCSV